ncbi:MULTISPECIES: GNAT family N-acetyltransferase [unclassified Planococcus (in: firmicutes)]|uniref:GNAT family N-acetyltransferase n=1 Tax=unclassified Planococcus (in: firmicutes) TaxID=2662419 RepID=UPI000C321D54|nr:MULTISPECIES: GNAT family protein [unclassified Planococcus (in: firmicutes)]AUD15015.1 GNAT family N-acetyltransferase [Planococcus sp. MB-3u-03]PKG47046.1 GNAT family N-acetyltransferase [Planococcus sp. Urea-trap-24]PKG87825.1 GNAT family N-acetyltransferase [Planococcus sp. Urea-3u-39]PKH35483.1 GNAT family N-acetyltransferase [Planococcus sp. MB-3u-09]
MVSNSIQLREFKKSDWEDVHKYASLEIVCRTQPWGPNSVEETIEYVDQIIVDAEKIPRIRFAYAVVHTEDDAMIGAGELTIKSFENSTAEIGYIINPDYWGRGVATEVAQKLIGFGFDKLNLHRIYATCAPENIASRKVLEKAGLLFEGQLRETLWVKGKWRDSLLYSVLENEWDGQGK